MCFIAKKFFNNLFLRQPSDSFENYVTESMDKNHYLNFMYSRLEWYNNQETEDIYISSYDDLKLYASFLKCKNKTSKNYVICFHSLNGTGITDFGPIAEFYHSNNFNLIITDQRVHGKSGGTYRGFGILERHDVVSWIHYAINRFGSDINIFLHGNSTGASTVLMASNMGLPENVKAIIADSGFTNAEQLFLKLQLNYLPKLPPLNNLIAKELKMMVKRKAGYNLNDNTTLNSLSQTDIPVLFIHGEADDFVPVEMTKQNYDACNSPKKVLYTKGATHLKSHYMNTQAYENAIKGYMDKYINEPIVHV